MLVDTSGKTVVSDVTKHRRKNARITYFQMHLNCILIITMQRIMLLCIFHELHIIIVPSSKLIQNKRFHVNYKHAYNLFAYLRAYHNKYFLTV